MAIYRNFSIPDHQECRKLTPFSVSRQTKKMKKETTDRAICHWMKDIYEKKNIARLFLLLILVQISIEDLRFCGSKIFRSRLPIFLFLNI